MYCIHIFHSHCIISFAIKREFYAFMCEQFALHCEGFAFICEKLVLYRGTYALTHESFTLILRYIYFFTYENEVNELSLIIIV